MDAERQPTVLRVSQNDRPVKVVRLTREAVARGEDVVWIGGRGAVATCTSAYDMLHTPDGSRLIGAQVSVERSKGAVWRWTVDRTVAGFRAEGVDLR